MMRELGGVDLFALGAAGSAEPAVEESARTVSDGAVVQVTVSADGALAHLAVNRFDLLFVFLILHSLITS